MSNIIKRMFIWLYTGEKKCFKRKHHTLMIEHIVEEESGLIGFGIVKK